MQTKTDQWQCYCRCVHVRKARIKIAQCTDCYICWVEESRAAHKVGRRWGSSVFICERSWCRFEVEAKQNDLRQLVGCVNPPVACWHRCWTELLQTVACWIQGILQRSYWVRQLGAPHVQQLCAGHLHCPTIRPSERDICASLIFLWQVESVLKSTNDLMNSEPFNSPDLQDDSQIPAVDEPTPGIDIKPRVIINSAPCRGGCTGQASFSRCSTWVHLESPRAETGLSGSI